MAAHGEAVVALTGAQNKLLGAEADADLKAVTRGEPKVFDAIHRDALDAASLSPENQEKLLGARTVYSAEEAVKSDRSKVSLATKTAPGNGAQMIALQLKGSDPEMQLELLKRSAGAGQAKDHLSAIAKDAGKSKETAAALLTAMQTTSGPARALLLDAMAQNAGPATAQALNDLLRRGEGYDLVAPLSAALKKAGKTEELGAVAGAAAGRLSSLRHRFEDTKKVTDELNGDLARMVMGFDGVLSDADKGKGVDAFKQRHAKEYGALKTASADYAAALTMFEMGGQLPKVGADVQKRVDRDQMLGNIADEATVGEEGLAKFAAETAAMAKYSLASIADTPEGNAAIQAALKQKSAGIPTWLDSVNTTVGKGKDAIAATNAVATVATNALARMALSGAKTEEIGRYLKANHAVLGLSAEAAEDFAKLAPQLTGHSDAAKKVALETLGQPEFKSLQIVGIALALPEAIQNWQKIGDASGLEVLNTAIKTGGLATDVASLLMKESAVLKGLGKGFGAAGAAFDIAGGINKLMEGQTINGSSDIASGVGAGLMLVPGGQLPGAALVLASLIAKSVWGEDPAADAEKADEGDVRAFLEGAGVSKPTAEALGNVRQSDRRNVGTFIAQAAPAFGMTGPQLLAHLQTLPKAKVDDFVKMVLEMPADKEWQYAKQKAPDTQWGPRDQAKQENPVNVHKHGPRSMPTAIEWMRKNGVAPDSRVRTFGFAGPD